MPIPSFFAFLLTLLLAPLAAVAQEDVPPPPPPVFAPVTGNSPSTSQDELEPEVRIYESKEGRIEETRVNGQVIKVKITPTKGRPYYLVDTDGDGDLDIQYDNPVDQGNTTMWKLFSW